MTNPKLDDNSSANQSWGAQPPQAKAVDDDERMVVLLAWGFLLAGIFTFVFGIVAAAIAYAKRSDAPEIWHSHYSAVIRMFWIWLILTVIGVPLTIILIGYIPLAIAAIWTAAVGVVGFLKALESRPA
jgi:uncharacterized membrane protein